MGAGFINAFSPINLLAMEASSALGITIGCLPGELGELIKAQDVFAREVISKLY